jgi:hypothetical protein
MATNTSTLVDQVIVALTDKWRTINQLANQLKVNPVRISEVLVYHETWRLFAHDDSKKTMRFTYIGAEKQEVVKA